MSIDKHEFTNACRRSRDEILRAINAATEAAASSHLRLSVLHAMDAVTMMSCARSMTDGRDRRFRRAHELLWLDYGVIHQ